MFAETLPFTSIDYQGDTYTFRSGKGGFEGVVATLKWNPKDETGKLGKISLYMANMEISNLRMTMDEETYGIGRLAITGLDVELSLNLGPPSELKNTKVLLYRIITNLTDLSSLLTSGLVQSMYRFTTPSNLGDVKSRKKERDSLAELMKNQFFVDLDLKISFNDLNLDNFIYIDKDMVKNDVGELKSEGSPDIEFIKGIKTGKTDITIKTIGVPEENKEELYLKKQRILKVNKDLIKQKGKKEKRIVKGKTNKSKREKKILSLENESRDLKHEIFKLQPDLTFDLEANVTGFDITKGEMLGKIGGGLLEDYTESTTGLGDATATSFTYKTQFNHRGIAKTSVQLNDITIPELTLFGLNYKAEDGSMVISANKAIFTNIKAKLGFDFKDQGVDRYNKEINELEIALAWEEGKLDFDSHPSLASSGKLDPSIMTRIVNLNKAILSKQKAFDPEATELAAYQEISQLRSQLNKINADIIGLQNPSSASKYSEQQTLKSKEIEKAELGAKIANKEKEYSAIINPIKSIFIESLDIPKAEVHALYLALPNKQLKADFADDLPVTLEGLFVKNLMVVNTGEGFVTEPGESSDKVKTGLTRLIVPKGLKIEQEAFKLNMDVIVAEGITLDIIRDKGIAYEMKSLSGSGTFDNMKINEEDPENMTNRLTFFKLPGTTDSSEPLIKGTYHDNVLSNTTYIPEIQIYNMNLLTEDSSIIAPPEIPIILTGIFIDTEIKFNADNKAANSIEEFTITSFKINEISSSGLIVDHKGMHVEIPDNKASIIKGLFVSNLRLTSSANEVEDENGNKEVIVKWNKENLIVDGKSVNTKSELEEINLPVGVKLRMGKKLGVEMSRISSGKIEFEFLETGGIIYSAKNLDAAGRFWQKDEEGKIIHDETASVDSKSISGSYKEETIGSGNDAKKKITVSNKDKFNLIHVPKLNISDGETKMYTTLASKGATIKNLVSDITIVFIKPSVNELKKNSKSHNKIKDDVTIDIKKLDMEKCTIAGMNIKKTTYDKDTQGNATKKEDLLLSFPSYMPIVVNELHSDGFKLHQSMDGTITKLGTITVCLLYTSDAADE